MAVTIFIKHSPIVQKKNFLVQGAPCTHEHHAVVNSDNITTFFVKCNIRSSSTKRTLQLGGGKETTNTGSPTNCTHGTYRNIHASAAAVIAI
jgi:hypothetical protein